MTLYEESLRLLDNRQEQLDPDDYNIVFMGDSWVGEDGYTSIDIFQSAMMEAQSYQPLLIMHGGDIVYTGLPENFTFFIARKKEFALEVPLFVAIGNHEMEKVNPPGPKAVANYQAAIGPLHYTLDVPRFRLTIIALNTLYHYIYPQYGLTTAELDFLDESLRWHRENTFVVMHVPPQTDEWVDPNEYFSRGSTEFFDEVEGRVSGGLVSHVHAFQTTTYRHTKLYLSGGGGAALGKNQLFHIVVFNIKNKHGKSKISATVVPMAGTRAYKFSSRLPQGLPFGSYG